MSNGEAAIVVAFARPNYWIEKLVVFEKATVCALDSGQLQKAYFDSHMNGCKLRSSDCAKWKKSVKRLHVDSYIFSALVNEMKFSIAFRKNFVLRWCSRKRTHQCETVIAFRLSNPSRYPLDYKWNYKIEAMVHRQLELEKLMWYMSTLGGAFSALGDLAVEYAQQAGAISWKQLKIAFCLGDPSTVARCKLYIAISFIQTGRLRAAKHLVRAQYNFVNSTKSVDHRQLKNACLGVWSKLQYAYKRRALQRQLKIDR